MKEEEDFIEDAELRNILDRYEHMIRDKRVVYFDVYQFERIIDYYLDGDLFSQAINAVDIGIQQHPSSNVLLLKKAEVLAEKGDTARAISILTDLEKVEYSNSELYILKGMIYNQMGNVRKAEKSFEKALSLYAESLEDILHDIAHSFEHIHQYKLAVKYLKRAYEINPEKLSLIYDLANCYEKLQEFNRSIEYYKIYLDLEPFSESVWFNLGLVYIKMEEYDKAIDAYDFALAVNDKYASAMLNKAIALSHSGQYADAIEVYNEFVDLEPDNVIAWCFLGECYEKLQQWQKAIRHYNYALKLDDEFSEAWYGLAVCYLNMEKYRDALSCALKAVEIDDENSDYWYTLGKIRIYLEEYRDATAAFSKATKIDPYDSEAWLNLAELGNILSGPKQAISVLKESYIYNFDVAEINYLMAGYYCLLGEKVMIYQFFQEGLKLSYNKHHLTFDLCPEIRNDKKILTLLSDYKSKS
ncbi:MAG: hypothetical protein AMS27_04765 [Bacteroides sp. SM23_62_1]|nr:MAG: hypothetical protein AMS27_04765 [Bacteroides sp. SM23_62_1]